MKNPILLCLLLCITGMFAQKNNPTTIHYNNGETKQFEKAHFTYNSEDYIIGVEAKTNTKKNIQFNLVGVNKVVYDGSTFIVKSYNKNLYLLEELIIGSISLYQSGQHYFIDNEEQGFKEIEKKVVNDFTLNTFSYAVISIYVNKCKEAQEIAFNKYDTITLSNLKAIIETYNNCKLSEDTQFATSIIDRANAPSETIEVGINIGYSFLNTSFDNLSPGVSNNNSTPVIGAQIYFNSNMLKNNLGFLLFIDYSFPEEFNSNENSTFIKTDLSYLTTMMGLRYTFNNMSKTFSPYLGLNGGFIFNSMSNIYYQNDLGGSEIFIYKPTNKLTYSLSVGSYIHFGKQKIDFNISYQPENKFDIISANYLNNQTSHYKMSSFQLKASYIF